MKTDRLHAETGSGQTSKGTLTDSHTLNQVPCGLPCVASAMTGRPCVVLSVVSTPCHIGYVEKPVSAPVSQQSGPSMAQVG